MKEEFVLQFIKQRMKQLGYTEYHIRYKEVRLDAVSSVSLDAYNDLYFLLDEPLDILITSWYGQYDSTSAGSIENIYQHRGQVSITNAANSPVRLRFIQAIIIR